MRVSAHIKQHVSIESLLDTFSKQKRVGGRIFYNCPMHADKTPSLTIDKLKGTFHCFSCKKHGDVIKLVMETEGCNFVEACSKLVEWFNIPAPIRQIRNRLHSEVSRLEGEGKKDEAKEIFEKYLETR